MTGGTIDDPFTSDAVTIGIEAGAGIGGGNALKVSKLGNANTNAGVRVSVPVAQYEQLGACFTLKTVNGGTGNLFATLQYACIQEHADNGISIVAKAAPAARCRHESRCLHRVRRISFQRQSAKSPGLGDPCHPDVQPVCPGEKWRALPR